MTTIQDRLTDAMNAAANTVREAELRPLAARKRRWRAHRPGPPRSRRPRPWYW